MKFGQIALTNFTLFFFVAVFFRGVINIGNSKSPNELTDFIIAGALFGLVMALTPKILEFMKIKESAGALVLIGVVTTFLYFFIGYYVLGIFSFSSSERVIMLNKTTELLTIKDQTVGLIVISLFSSIFSVILQLMGTSKKK